MLKCKSGLLALLLLTALPVMASSGKVAQANNNQHEQTELERQAKLKAFLQQSAKERKQHQGVASSKHVRATIEKLTDNSGLVYIGAKVDAAELAPYLHEMVQVLGAEKFARFRANQAARDGHSFHLTLVNPFEYQALKKALPLGQSIEVTLHGLGRAYGSDGKQHQTLFVVASSSDGQFYRQQLALQNKDFHITLGFEPSDVFGVSKGLDSLIDSSVAAAGQP